MIDYGAVMKRCGIEAKDVLHIGAHEGHEDTVYQRLGFKNRLFIEAQPDTFAVLSKNLEGTGALCENIAISDRQGFADFYTTSFSQSSSLLKLDKHLEVYPSVTDAGVQRVKTTRVDDILSSETYRQLDYNFMNVDIQGAELLCLSGACASLSRFDILNLEVNFDTLYKDAVHVSQLDAFLSVFDFIRVDTVLFHASWGDAIYVRNRFTKVTQKTGMEIA